MIQALLKILDQADSGLFIHAPEGTCQQLAEALGEAGKPLTGLTETESSALGIEQLADQLAVPAGHTIATTLEAASRLIGEPIYLLIDRAERFEHSDLTYFLKAARDALSDSELAGLRLALFSTDRAALERMTRLQGAAFFCAPLLDVADEISWESAPAVGLEFGSVESDLLTRERVRRKALWALRSKEKRAQAIQDLLRVRRADIEYPIGPAAHLSVDEIAAIVPIHMHEGRLPIVRDRDIPEPWGTRFAIASVGSTRIAPGAYEHDWRNFLEIWPRENAEIDELFEAELERAISAGFSQGLARGSAKRAELGVDDDELYAWVQERCRIGFWPEGDLLEEFRAWSAQIKAHPPILIIDLENTCMHEQERPADYHHQIIEIGAAWVTETGEVLAKFSTLVQAENPVTEFCTELLGITQADVDRGLPFCEAMQALAGFAALYPSTTWASWGAADLNSLNCDCTHHGLESPLQGWVHRNLKKEWAKARKIKRVGMAKALEIAGIALEGAHHRALDDVLNLAKLYTGQENTPNADSSEPSTSWASLQNLPKADPDFLQEREEIIDVNPGSRSP